MINKDEIEKYFKGSLHSDSEKKSVEESIINDFDNTELDKVLMQLIETDAQEGDEELTRSALVRVKRRAGIDSPLKRAIRVVAHYGIHSAAAILLLVVGAMGYKMHQLSTIASPEWVEVYAPIGKTMSVVMPDSTIIELNSGSKLVYAKNHYASDRSVFITGEAYAEVAKDSEHPFTMSCNNMKVKVLGTKFKVQSYEEDNDMEVNLYEGSVKLETDINGKADTIYMRPGNVIKIDKSNGKILSYDMPKNSQYKTSKGSFYFVEESFSDIANQLERHFGKHIHIEDKKLANEKYFAIFANGESLEEILSSLNSQGKMSIKEVSDNVIVISRK